MKMVIGLGNPGRQYEATRHNIGFMVVGRLADEQGIRVSKKVFSSLWSKGMVAGREVMFLLPQEFMNRSGGAVQEAASYYRVSSEELLVVHDDLDLPLGRVKVDFDSGGAGHRGVGSIIEALGTKKFHRVRIGIGRPVRKEEVEGFVLSPFDPGDREVVEGMIDEAVAATKRWIEGN